MSRMTVYLVIRADRTLRIGKRPRIGPDEIGIPVILEFPDSWGKVLAEPIRINVPDFTPEVIHEQAN